MQKKWWFRRKRSCSLSWLPGRWSTIVCQYTYFSMRLMSERISYQDWTGDLLITSQMRYHCAKPACSCECGCAVHNHDHAILFCPSSASPSSAAPPKTHFPNARFLVKPVLRDWFSSYWLVQYCPADDCSLNGRADLDAGKWTFCLRNFSSTDNLKKEPNSGQNQSPWSSRQP